MRKSRLSVNSSRASLARRFVKGMLSKECRQISRQKHALIEINRAPQDLQRVLLATQHIDPLADEEVEIVLQAIGANDKAAFGGDVGAIRRRDADIRDEMSRARARLFRPMIAALQLCHPL